MDQRLAWVILKTKRKNRKEGQELSKNFSVQLLKCWIIL